MDQVTQRLSLTIQNNLIRGSVSLKNFKCPRGEPYKKGNNSMFMPHEDVNRISIPRNRSATVSVCGSATFGLGVEGTLDLYHDESGRIASLSWDGPWSRIGNELLVHDLAEDKFALEVSSPPNKGILGDLIVDVKDRHSTKSSCFISCVTANVLF